MTETFAPGSPQKISGDEAASAIDQEAFVPWSKQQADAWRRTNPALSPWRVVVAQAVAGLACGAVAWGVTQRGATAVSALYGAAAVVVPSALLARGMTRTLGNRAGAAGHAAFRFMFWETVKMVVAVAMLVAAPRVVQGLSWPALLVAMIVCAKMNLWALLWQRRRQ